MEVGFDYSVNYELMEEVVREARLWEQVREVAMPVNVAAITGTVDGELGAEECFRRLRKRGLRRHHALADAHALACAYQAVKGRLLRPDG